MVYILIAVGIIFYGVLHFFGKRSTSQEQELEMFKQHLDWRKTLKRRQFSRDRGMVRNLVVIKGDGRF